MGNYTKELLSETYVDFNFRIICLRNSLQLQCRSVQLHRCFPPNETVPTYDKYVELNYYLCLSKHK